MGMKRQTPVFRQQLVCLVLLKGVTLGGLLHSLDHRLIDAEGDGDAEKGQQQVGDHTDDAERCERQQHQHGQTEHQARLLGVSPVNQILDCKEGEEEKLDLVRHFYCTDFWKALLICSCCSDVTVKSQHHKSGPCFFKSACFPM